jgi:hypothetical protein
MTVLYIDVAKYHDICAGDTPRGQPDAMAVAQKSISARTRTRRGGRRSHQRVRVVMTDPLDGPSVILLHGWPYDMRSGGVRRADVNTIDPGTKTSFGVLKQIDQGS